MVNVEGLHDYDIGGRPTPNALKRGLTAVLRVKNEAHNLPFVLPPLFRSVAHVIIADNGSTDGTSGVARDLARDHGAGNLEVLHYPFEIARCGSEHLATPPDSVRSLVYFYNWAFSHVRTTYAVKWDGDMVLSQEGEQIFRDLEWQLEYETLRVRMMAIPLYMESPTSAWADVGMRHFETYAWPNLPDYFYGKFLEWELLRFPIDAPKLVLPVGVCLEIKRLETDEFSHWSTLMFDGNPRLGRKSREQEVFRQLRANRRMDGLVRLAAEEGGHVMDRARGLSVPEWAALRAEADEAAAPSMETGGTNGGMAGASAS
jgi:glycosyltransferase involved in cell wall biosynthesis